jgi:hypothetical protein
VESNVPLIKDDRLFTSQMIEWWFSLRLEVNGKTSSRESLKAMHYTLLPNPRRRGNFRNRTATAGGNIRVSNNFAKAVEVSTNCSIVHSTKHFQQPRLVGHDGKVFL